MDKSFIYAVSVIAVCAVFTSLTRIIPFAVFSSSRPVPKIVEYLGKVLPPTIIATLVIFCIKDVDFTSAKSIIPQAICIFVAAALHIFKRNTLLSIGTSTILYMILVALPVFS